MAEMWKPYDAQTYEMWVAAIKDEASDRLTDWETNFVENINNQLDYNANLSKAQSDTLERIYTKYTS